MKFLPNPKKPGNLNLILTAFLSLAFCQLSGQQPQVNADRLDQSLQQLATYGRDVDGQPNRVAYSDGDIAGRAYAISLMQEAGLSVRTDAAGNIIGTRPGTQAGLKPLAMGSHIDMVPHGGNYDGCVGSLSAIEVARTLYENNIQLRHPLEVCIFTDEEGSLTGSRAMVGKLSPEALQVTNSTGYTVGEGIQRLGGDTLALKTAAREKGSLAAFLELHIEQGAILDRENLQIGVVEGIVGLKWWDVTFRGRANHAGTTPMNMRQDALLAAARFIQAVNEEAVNRKGTQVATVGRINALPGAPNVIPGEVMLSLEIRDLSDDVITEMYAKITARAEAIAADSGISISFEHLDTTAKPALTDSRIQALIETEAGARGYSSKRMKSGAGHDTQDMAQIAPAGMIFVPSRGGISHAPDEYTAPEAIARGANVLLGTLLRLDREWE